jgi:hypothetical protein
MGKRMVRPAEKVQGLVEESPARCCVALDEILYCLARFVRFSCNEIRNEIVDATPRQWTSEGPSEYRALEFLAVATVKTFKGEQGRPSRNKQVPLRRAGVLRGVDVWKRQPERVASDE